jgi:hypothetical protein
MFKDPTAAAYLEQCELNPHTPILFLSSILLLSSHVRIFLLRRLFSFTQFLCRTLHTFLCRALHTFLFLRKINCAIQQQ